ncbi:MAG: PAS domain S-box protein, partial [Hyphomicrobiaceae bacterium]
AVNMLVDLTERSQTEQARQLLASIVESSDDAIVSKDLNGVIASWNPGAERLFGYTADEVLGKSVPSLFPADLQNEERVILGRIGRGERLEHYETVRCRKDGSLVDISLTVSPLRNAAGKVTGVSKIARDISLRKKVEHERALALQD